MPPVQVGVTAHRSSKLHFVVHATPLGSIRVCEYSHLP